MFTTPIAIAPHIEAKQSQVQELLDLLQEKGCKPYVPASIWEAMTRYASGSPGPHEDLRDACECHAGPLQIGPHLSPFYRGDFKQIPDEIVVELRYIGSHITAPVGYPSALNLQRAMNHLAKMESLQPPTEKMKQIIAATEKIAAIPTGWQIQPDGEAKWIGIDTLRLARIDDLCWELSGNEYYKRCANAWREE